MLEKMLRVLLLLVVCTNTSFAYEKRDLVLENNKYRIVVDQEHGSISSFLIKQNGSDLIAEKRLIANFRICLQKKDDLTIYIDGMDQKPLKVSQNENIINIAFSGLSSPKGNFPIDLSYTIQLIDDYVSFKARLKNNSPDFISEFWFPRIGGWKNFGNNREAKLAVPGYIRDCQHNMALFKKFPCCVYGGTRELGGEASEYSTDYPERSMPWWSIYDSTGNTGLYLGYHDTVCRWSTWHMYLTPNISGDTKDSWLTEEQSAGLPVGIIFSHVRYPFIRSGETYDSGEFIVRAHNGDWHNGSQFYRGWFVKHFPFDKSKSWLRKTSSWFSSILYQPEDKIIADFKRYGQWTSEAKKFGITNSELVGWSRGGIERNYPDYYPEEKLGGRQGFRDLIKSIHARGDRLTVYCNYNILDQNTDWYKRELNKYMAQDQFGKQGIFMAWGESNLLARKSLSVRYHVRSSVVPGISKILEDQLLEVVKDGADAFQIDKLVMGSSLDFNPLNTMKPDEALCEGLVQAIGRLFKKSQAINPEFQIASEVGLDRLIPYIDIGYRSSIGYEVCPLHYVFPEWTSAQHVSGPRDLRGINGAAITGSAIVIEPDVYQGSLDQPVYHFIGNYLQEVERIRKELTDYCFTGRYMDNLGAKAIATNLQQAPNLHFKVWLNEKTGKRAIVVANDSSDPVTFTWEFTENNIKQAQAHQPFTKSFFVEQSKPITLQGTGLIFLIEK